MIFLGSVDLVLLFGSHLTLALHQQMSRKAYLLAALVAIVAIFVAIDINRERFYVFDPEVLHKVASEVGTMNISTKAKIDRVVSELAKIYPKYIDTHEEWIFNVAAGAMGHMTLLHCSITEYIMIFGSAIGTEGYSGRYMSDDYFSIIEGEQHSYFVGELEPRIYRPGSEVNLMPRGVATGYKMPHKTYALGTFLFDAFV